MYLPMGKYCVYPQMVYCRLPLWMTETFDRISLHFRSIWNFFFFYFFSQNGCWRPFWMTDNHFRSHFSPFQISMQLFFLWFFRKMAAGGHFGWPNITFDRISRHQNGRWRPFWKSDLGHFGWLKITFDRISRHLKFSNFGDIITHSIKMLSN